MAIVPSHYWANSDKHIVETTRQGECNECGRPADYIGFYGQHFCGERCSGFFLSRMHAGQDAHARGGFQSYEGRDQ